MPGHVKKVKFRSVIAHCRNIVFVFLLGVMLSNSMRNCDESFSGETDVYFYVVYAVSSVTKRLLLCLRGELQWHYLTMDFINGIEAEAVVDTSHWTLGFWRQSLAVSEAIVSPLAMDAG